MPPGPHGGLTTAKKLRNEYPGLGLLFLTNYGTTNYIMGALDINNEAIGYRLKERVNSVGNLTDTLTRINNGEIVIEPVLVKRLVDRTRGDKKDPVAKLKPLESDVLKLMAEGHANQGIADKLHRGLGTVEKSITAIFSQLGLPDTGTHHRRVLAVLAYLRAQRPDN
jgi:DNA-binding NarL/FixJ family response regulator